MKTVLLLAMTIFCFNVVSGMENDRFVQLKGPKIINACLQAQGFTGSPVKKFANKFGGKRCNVSALNAYVSTNYNSLAMAAKPQQDEQDDELYFKKCQEQRQQLNSIIFSECVEK